MHLELDLQPFKLQHIISKRNISINNSNHVIVTVGSNERIEFCKSIGATDGINYKTNPNFNEKVKELTNGKGVDFVLDFIGATYWNNNIDSLAIDGRMIILGFMGGVKLENVDISPFLRKRITVTGSSLRSRSLDYQIQLRDIFVQELLPQIIKDNLKPIIDREFNWNQIVEAHIHMESNANMGKIVVSTE